MRGQKQEREELKNLENPDSRAFGALVTSPKGILRLLNYTLTCVSYVRRLTLWHTPFRNYQKSRCPCISARNVGESPRVAQCDIFLEIYVNGGEKKFSEFRGLVRATGHRSRVWTQLDVTR